MKRWSLVVVLFTGLVVNAPGSRSEADGGKVHTIDWANPPTVPYEMKCGDSLRIEWDAQQPKGLWKLHEEWCPSSFTESPEVGLLQLSESVRKGSVLLKTKPLTATIWYFADPLNCHRNSITWVVVTCPPIGKEQAMMSHGEFNKIPHHQVRFVNWSSPSQSVPMHARCGDVVHLEWERPGGKAPHSLWRVFSRECPSEDDHRNGIELLGEYNMSAYHFEIPTSVCGRIYLTDGFNNFERCRDSHLVMIIVSCRDLNRKDQHGGGIPLIELPINRAWRFMAHVSRTATNCRNRSGCRPTRDVLQQRNNGNGAVLMDLPVNIIKAATPFVNVPAPPLEVSGRIADTEGNQLPNGSLESFEPGDEIILEPEEDESDDAELLGPGPAPLVGPSMGPATAPLGGPAPSDEPATEFPNASRRRRFLISGPVPIQYQKAPIPDVIVPPLPPEIDAQVVETQMNYLPNGSAVQTILLQNGTVFSRTLDPPPPPLPPLITESMVASRVYTRDSTGESTDNITFTNGTWFYIQNFGVYQPPLPLGLQQMQIATRTLLTMYNGTTVQTITLVNGTVFQWTVHYPIIDIPSWAPADQIRSRELDVLANNTFLHILQLNNGSTVFVSQAPITPPYYAAANQGQGEEPADFTTRSELVPILRRDIQQNPNGMVTEQTLLINRDVFCSEVVPIMPVDPQGLPENLPVTGRRFEVGPTGISRNIIFLAQGSSIELAAEPIIEGGCSADGPAPEPAPEIAPEPAPEIAPEVASEPAPEVAPEPAPEMAPEPAPEMAPEPAPPSVLPPDVAPEPDFGPDFPPEPPFGPVPNFGPTPGIAPAPSALTPSPSSPMPPGSPELVIPAGSDMILNTFILDVPQDGPIPGPPLPDGVSPQDVTRREFSTYANGTVIESLTLKNGTVVMTDYQGTLDFSGSPTPDVPEDQIEATTTRQLADGTVVNTLFLKNGSVVTNIGVVAQAPISGGTVPTEEIDVTNVTGAGGGTTLLILEAPSLAPLPSTVFGLDVISQQTVTSANGSQVLTAELSGNGSVTAVANPGQPVVTYITIPASTPSRRLQESMGFWDRLKSVRKFVDGALRRRALEQDDDF